MATNESKALGAFRRFWQAGRRGSPALMTVAVGAGVLLAVSLLLQQVDGRMVGGVSAWLKPAKFGASTLLAAPMLALILGLLPTTRGRRRAAGIFAGTIVTELVLITLQAVRGVPSHFNFTTLLDTVIFQTMAVAITAFWITQMWLTWKTFRTPMRDGALAAGVRMGMLISTLGAGLAFGMTAAPKPEQVVALEAGQASMIGGHTVGAPDDGPGMPVTRWSAQGGDLRVAHFLGLHALQVLPAFGFVVSRMRRRRPVPSAVVTVVGVGYAGLVLTTFVQAMRAQPLLSPDGVTLASVMIVVGATLLGVAALVLRPRTHTDALAVVTAPSRAA